ncbi:hypothetical protein MMC07_000328 [Pseudocyphellaria aurata]|nr:hypothetical protein [Pseudocyphellaria aurata]
MRLLPIIIVVSLLGLLLIISGTLFTFHYMNVRARRKSPQMTQENQRPIRQLTVRRGKVIPISEAVQTASTRDVRSLDLSTIRSGASMKSKLSQDRTMRSPRATIKSFDRRHSSALADLEAQNEASETWEANVQRLHYLDEGLRDPRYINSTRSRPKKKSDSNLGRPPTSIETHKNESEATKFTPESRKQQPGVQKSNRHTSGSLQGPYHAVPTNTIRPPQSAFLNRHSTPAEQQRPLDWMRSSFFSTSVSEASSTQLHLPGAAEKAHASPLADRQDRPSEPPAPVRGSHSRPKSSIQNSRAKPHKIDTKVPNIRDTSFIDSATSSATTVPNLQRESMMSSSSIATFASSDLSSTWTFGNAQPIAILPGIMSRPPAPSPGPSSRRPKSKYGRYPKKRKDKELPIVPRSPLAR